MTISLTAVDAADRDSTPGPWTVFNLRVLGCWSVMGPDQEQPIGGMERLDDAELIALYRNASPVLAQAIRAVLALAEGWRYKGEFGWGPWQSGEGPDLEGTVLDEVAAAIRKAITDAGVTE